MVFIQTFPMWQLLRGEAFKRHLGHEDFSFVNGIKALLWFGCGWSPRVHVLEAWSSVVVLGGGGV